MLLGDYSKKSVSGQVPAEKLTNLHRGKVNKQNCPNFTRFAPFFTHRKIYLSILYVRDKIRVSFRLYLQTEAIFHKQ